jgi:hypothetical protein
MAIQYSGGTLINRTFTPANRADLVNNLTQAVSDAGWTNISGTDGSGADVIMETATSAGAKCRVRFFDPAANNCAQITLKHATGSPTSQIVYCLPSNTWRVIANKYGFGAFMTTAGNVLAQRGWVFLGEFYQPSWLQVTSGDTCAFIIGAGSTDTDATARTGWRRAVRANAAVPSTIYGATLIDYAVGTTNVGIPGLCVFQGGLSSQDQGFRWDDGTFTVIEPIVAWATGSVQTNEARLKGQLFDAMIVAGSWTAESTISFDGHTWMAITDTPTVSVAATCTLFLAVA